MEIHVLSNETINKIAAGEVVERPFNVAKELIENSIDAGATAISVEIKDGGTTMLRVTDNGCGIPPEEITRAFLRHATSKINDEEDLLNLVTLGFRGEALSSIAAVSEVEMITKVRGSLNGIRVVNSGIVTKDTDVIPLEVSEIGAPDGTTVIVRNLFYNVPVRRKFLKSAITEAGYISDLMEHMALSHPEISFHYRLNGKEKLHTSGNGNIKEIIYRIYGGEIAKTILPVHVVSEEDGLALEGFIGKPEISRGSRSFEVFFVNGRILESNVLSKGVEAGYGTDLMQHQFPFSILYLTVPSSAVDVNVHPAKKEVRFEDGKKIYDFLCRAVQETLHGKELIPEATLKTNAEIKEEERKEKEEVLIPHSEPFENRNVTGYVFPETEKKESFLSDENKDYTTSFFVDRRPAEPVSAPVAIKPIVEEPSISVPEEEEPSYILTEEKAASFKIIGQLFDTYWIIESDERMLLIDQHAAHEKVRFERLMKQYKESAKYPAPSQNLLPPIVINFSGKEESCFKENQELLQHLGFEIEDFGSGAYAIRAVPLELYGVSPEKLLLDVIDEILNGKIAGDPADVINKLASISCKGAVKANMRLSIEEAKALILEMLKAENPYHCPHGRPTCIILSKQEIEKKFKRIL